MECPWWEEESPAGSAPLIRGDKGGIFSTLCYSIPVDLLSFQIVINSYYSSRNSVSGVVTVLASCSLPRSHLYRQSPSAATNDMGSVVHAVAVTLLYLLKVLPINTGSPKKKGLFSSTGRATKNGCRLPPWPRLPYWSLPMGLGHNPKWPSLNLGIGYKICFSNYYRAKTTISRSFYD